MVENGAMDLITPALVTGAISILSAIAGAIAGVGWATRKSSIAKRAKFETKERIKIENNKEIIEAIKGLDFVINDAKYKISFALINIFTDIGDLQNNIMKLKNMSLAEVQNLNTNNQEIDNAIKTIIVPKIIELERGNNRIREELKKIKDIIFLLECDLQINDKNAEIVNKLNELKNIYEEMKNVLRFEIKGKTIKEIFNTVSELRKKYSASMEASGDEEVNKILLDLSDAYLQRLN